MATTTNFGWETPDDTDLVKDGALAIRTLGSAIDTSLVDLKGGTTGQVLSKTSNTDMDFTWVAQDDSNAIQNAIVDAKGDLITATANDTPARLGVGSNGQVLTADSTTATGLKWAAAAAGGKLLQLVQDTHSTAVSTTSTTFVNTDLDATITPSSTSSKILVLVFQNSIARTGGAGNGIEFQIVRNSTALITCGKVLYTANDIGAMHNPGFFAYLDSPATTSAITYKTQFKVDANTITALVQQDGKTGVILLAEIGA